MMDNWVVSSTEIEGSTEGMVWMNRGKERGLFKPDLSGNDFKIEQDVTKIAEFFGIDYCKVEKFVLNSIQGFISIKKEFKRFEVINGYDLRYDSSSWKFNKIRVDSKEKIYPEFIDYSLEFFKDFPIYEDLCKIAFIDSIVKNMDRHLGNLSFILDINKNLCGVYPIYDNVSSLLNSNSENALLSPKSNKIYKHDEVLLYLYFIDFMKPLFNLYSSKDFDYLVEKLNFSEFILKRREIFIKKFL